MQKTIKVLLTVLVSGILCMPIFAQTPVPVPNGSFESWADSGASGPPDDWTIDSGALTCPQEGTTVYAGSYSTAMTWTSVDNQYLLSDYIACTASEIYTISAWFLDNDPAGRVRAFYKWYDSGQVFLANSYQNSYTIDDAAWQEYVYTLTSHASAAYLRIGIVMYDYGSWDGDATVYADYITLTEGVAGNLPPTLGTIYRYPYPTVFPTDDVVVEAQITDSDGTIAKDSLYYQTTSAVLVYTPVYHDSVVGDYYYYTIPAQAAGTLVEYYVIAEDDDAERVESSVLSYTVSNPPHASLQNPGFELWTINGAGGPPDNWTIDTYITATQEATTVHGGTYSANLTWTSTTQASCDFNSDAFLITENENYVCSVYVYDNDPSGEITLYLAWSTGNTWSGSYSVDQAGWQVMTYSAIAPAGAVSVQIGIRGYDVTGWDGDATVYVDDVTFGVASSGPPELSIYEVQFNNTDPGTSPNCYPSPELGNLVSISGVVSATLTNNARFYIQDADSLWSGVYVYNALTGVAVGDSVTLVGSMAEYNGVTEVSSATVTNHGTGTIYSPVPVQADELGSVGCAVSAEPYEGMLVELTNFVPTSGPSAYGEYWGSDGSGDSCMVDGYIFTDPWSLTLGETYSFIRGVCHYSYNQYRIYPRNAADLEVASAECTADYTIYDIQANYTFLDDIDNCFPSTFIDSGFVSVCGVVTAVDNLGSGKGIFLQDPDGTTFEGVLWYDMIDADGDTVDLTTVSIGDYYQVSTFVSEYHGITELDTLVDFTLLGTSHALPETSVTNVNTLRQPLPNGCSFTGEPYEGVLVKITDLTVLSTPGFGKWWVTDPSTTDSILLGPDIYDMTGSAYPPSTGLLYEYVVGIMTFDYYDDRMKLQPRMDSDLQASIIPPPDVSAGFPIDQSTLCLMFDRALDQTSAENPGNYTIGSGLSVTAALLDADLQRVFLTLSPDMGNGTADMAYVSGVEDTAGIAIVSDSVNFWQGFTPISQFQTLTNPGGDNTYPTDMNLEVVTIKGVIVADTTAFQDSVPSYYPANNIYINDNSGPPQNGVLVYVNYTYWDPSMHIPQIGDEVVMTAQVQEYYGETELSNLDDYKNVYLVSTGPVPDPVYLTYDAGDFSYNTYDAIRESFEGVLVKLCDSLEVVSVDANTDTARVVIRSLSDPADTIAFDYKYRNYNLPIAGDRYDGLTGVVRWRWGYWRFQPRSPADFNTGYNCEPGGDEFEYLPGDANMNVGAWPPQVIGGDVTYLVGYFRGINAPCLLGGFYCSGDINGDCSVIGSDVTRLVSYFRGIATITPCADYPPAWPTPGDLPPSAPAGWPNCETPPVTSSKALPTGSLK